MKQRILAALLATGLAAAQESAADREKQELQEALRETGGVAVELIRALEQHLKKYPGSAQRADIEKALVRAALEQKDDRRLILYGERVLAKDKANLPLLERVSRALLNRGHKEDAPRALQYAQQLEQGLQEFARKTKPQELKSPDSFKADLSRAVGRAQVQQARAYLLLGQSAAAVKAARAGWAAAREAEAARELSKALAATGDNDGALRALANAVAVEDTRSTASQKAVDRLSLTRLWLSTHPSEQGLGDLVWQVQKELGPGPVATDKGPLDFTATTVDGQQLDLATLKGKVIVMDFWATWCGPCRQQHGLYEQVQQQFKDRPDVVFLYLNTDEDRAAVKPFLAREGWQNTVHFDPGLASLLTVNSIPTTVVFGKNGEVGARFNGFIPERFVDMLSSRITELLAE